VKHVFNLTICLIIHASPVNLTALTARTPLFVLLVQLVITYLPNRYKMLLFNHVSHVPITVCLAYPLLLVQYVLLDFIFKMVYASSAEMHAIIVQDQTLVSIVLAHITLMKEFVLIAISNVQLALLKITVLLVFLMNMVNTLVPVLFVLN
jgi:hypothetical protein